MSIRFDSATPFADGVWELHWAESPGAAMQLVREAWLSAISNVIGETSQYARADVGREFGWSYLAWALVNTVDWPSNGAWRLIICPWVTVSGSGPGLSTQNLPIEYFLMSDGWNGAMTSDVQKDDSGAIDFAHTESRWEQLVPGAKGAMLAGWCTPDFTAESAAVYSPGSHASYLDNNLSLQVYSRNSQIYFAHERIALLHGGPANGFSDLRLGPSSNQAGGYLSTGSGALIQPLSQIADAVTTRDRLVSINHGGIIFNADGTEIIR